MMKKKLVVLATAFTIFTLGASFIGSMAWFMNTVTLSNFTMNGDSVGAYFAYGDGLPYEEDNQGNVIHRPYGINTPRHLYNLAWLQYNGDFNKDSNSDGVLDKQCYFEIDPNLSTPLNMSKWTLPPIGTETYPFLGNFNAPFSGAKVEKINERNAICHRKKHFSCFLFGQSQETL